MRKVYLSFLIMFVFLNNTACMKSVENWSTTQSLIKNIEKRLDDGTQTKENIYNDLYTLGMLYFSVAVAKKQSGDSSYYTDLNKAIEHLNHAIKINNLVTRAYTLIVSIYKYLGDEENMMANVNKILEIDPDNLAANLTLGTFYYDKGDFYKALPLLEKVERILANNPEICEGKKQEGLEKMLSNIRTKIK